MTNPQSLFEQAETAFDELRFDDAIRLYKQVLAEEFDSIARAHLKLAEDMWHLNYVRSVVERNPDLISAHIDRIFLELKAGQLKNAIELSTHVLNNIHTTRIQKYRLSSLRFRASIANGATDYLLHDFRFVWHSLSTTKGRYKLLCDLLSVNEPKLVNLFVELANDNDFSFIVQNIFRAKATLLSQLEKIDRSQLEDL